MKISVVIPTKNEEKTIEAVIKNVTDEIKKSNHELQQIFIVDDSKDETRKIASSHNAEVVIGGGRGLGYAMYKGLKVASNSGCDIILAIDGDGQADLTEVHDFLVPVQNGQADFVIGSRFRKKGDVKYKYRWRNRFGTIILSSILRYITKQNITDSHGGLRAMRKEVAEELEMIGTHSYVQETIIDAVEKGFTVKEIPSVWLQREHGSSKVVSSIFTYICYILPVLIVRAKFHIKGLFLTGLVFILAAFADLGYVLYETNFSLQEMLDRQSFHLFFLLLIFGINLFFFGIIIEFLSLTLKGVNKNDAANY